MGWLYMTTLNGFATPKAYLEDQFTYQNETKSSAVLASAMIQMRTWYAACRQVDKQTGATETFAIICLVDHKLRAKDGQIFGYKDMTEHMGPCEIRCPGRILDLLSPTDHEHALTWRRRCRELQQKYERPPPKEGDLIVFAETISFTDGHEGRRFRVIKRGRQMTFVNSETRMCYRISSWKGLAWTIIPKIEPAPLAA